MFVFLCVKIVIFEEYISFPLSASLSRSFPRLFDESIPHFVQETLLFLRSRFWLLACVLLEHGLRVNCLLVHQRLVHLHLVHCRHLVRR